MPRRTTLSARLARMGFADPAQAERLAGGDLALDIDSGDAGLLAALAAAADPDLALAALARMPRDAELLTALHQDADLARRLAVVLGASAALGDHLARHPEGWRLLRGPRHAGLPVRWGTALGAPWPPSARTPVPRAGGGDRAGGRAGQPGPAAALQVAYRQRLLLPVRPGTSPASWRSTTWPPSWPTWRRRRWRRRWRSPARSCRPGRRRVGWP